MGGNFRHHLHGLINYSNHALNSVHGPHCCPTITVPIGAKAGLLTLPLVRLVDAEVRLAEGGGHLHQDDLRTRLATRDPRRD